MLFVAPSVLPLRLVTAKLCLLVFALSTLLLPAVARAQTATGGGISISAGDATVYTSTVSVTSATGPVATVAVELDGVNTKNSNYSMQGVYFMLTSPGGAQFEFLGGTGDTYDGCDSNTNLSCDGLQGSSADYITVTDSASYIAPPGPGSPQGQFGGWLTSDMPYTVKPSSYGAYGYQNPPLPSSPNQADWPQSDGCAQPDAMNLAYGCTDGPNGGAVPTFNSRFNNLSASGTWTLSMVDSLGDAVSISGWKLYLTYSTATVIQTTTSVSSSANPATYANSVSSASVTLTATVATSPTGQGTPTGTVNFAANGTTLSGCAAVALSSGQAHCTTALAQGNNAIIATYSPSGNFVTSSGAMTELVEVTSPSQSGNQWCSSSPIAQPADGTPLAYPAIIHVTGYPSGTTVGNVSVNLNGVSGTAGITNAFLLVAPGGGAHNLDFLDFAFDAQSVSNVNLTISDTGALENENEATTGTYLPYDGDTLNNNGAFPSSPAPGIDSNIPQVPGSPNHPQSVGTFTLEQAFGGSPANGDWALYLNGQAPVTVSSWCVDFTINSGTATTTTVSTNNAHATSGQSVNFTATVSSSSTVNEGSVTFVDTTTEATLASNVAVSSGSASFSTAALAEGDHKITATYSGTNNFDTSFGSVEQRVDHATVVTNVSGDTWNYCNTGAVQIQEGVSGAYTPNPSNVFVTGFPGTFESAAVTLNNFSVADIANYETEALLEGPSGSALDFFSNTGGESNNVISLGNYTFEDAASGLVPNSGSISPGTYQPTAYANDLGGSEPFTSSYFYPVPGSFSLAAPAGSNTFGSVFPNTLNPNGTWSLFFNQHYPENAQADGAANGWCMQLVGNPPVVTVSASHDGSGTGNDFAQGQQNAELTVGVKNTGPGSTGDPSSGNFPMTVVDTLNSAFTYASGSGTNWSCSNSGQTVTCTNDSAIADGDSYPDLTINVNVSGSASGTVSNSVTASGAGVASTPSNSDSITILPPPVLAVTTTPIGTFTQGSTAEWDVTVSNTAPNSTTSGTVTVVDTLPSGYTVSSFGTNTGWSCSGTNTVTCTSGTSVAGGNSFPTIQIFVNVPSTSPTSVKNNVIAYGGGDPNHTNAGNAASAISTVTVVQVAAAITVNGGGTQSTTVSTAFATPLAVTVKDANGTVISNASVTFTAPSTGASGTFSNSTNTISVNTNGSGVASAGTFTANGTAGGPYNVTATAGSQSTSFSLTNTLAQFVLTIGANPSIGGTVTPTSGGSYSQGTVVPITATANAGYVFAGWTSNPDSVANSSSATTSITMNAAETVTANFTAFATAAATTTSIASSQNPSFTSTPNNSVTFTATVLSNSNPVTVGTVAFSSGGTVLPGCSAVALNGSGQAQCPDSFTAEGTLTIAATYSGYSSVSASYLTSNGSVSQEVDNHTIQSGNQFCNTGTIAVPNASGPAVPYPSRIFVTGLSGNVGKLTLQFNNINSSDTQPTDLMLVGPTGAEIIPFAGVGNSATISGVNITLDDAAADLLPGSALISGTFKPTSMTGGTSLAFPAPAPAASAADYAATDGSATLSSTFNNTAPNGTWSLYAMASGSSGSDSISGGWCVNITPGAAPAITSANSANANLNAAFSFTVTTTGSPTPSISEQGSLPTGVSFHDNGNGTGTLSGTPTVGGSFSISFTASNGAGTNAVQDFTLNVGNPPAITSANATTFTTGTLGAFTVTTTGSPTPSLSEAGSLPSGVSFVDNGNGTATLSGTPAAGTGRTYSLSIGAQNGVTPNASQSFTLTVDQAPAITSASSTTFATGTSSTFTVTATGFPTPTITEAGTLPTGVSFSSGVLSGTPTQSGSFPISFTASNGVGSNATQSFTLTVSQAPAITSANNTTFVVGTAGTFTVTATGSPTPTITEAGTLPTGVTFSGGVLSGTPTQSGSFAISFTASNGVTPNATQSFTLIVDQAPAITSASSTTFATGTSNTFTVTATGFPTPTITEVGTLPTGVSFSGGTLSGTPTQSGTFPITFHANNGIGTQATQSFTLTVSQAPAITSANNTTFVVGTAGTFTVTATGSPTPTITEAGTLPTGVTFSGGVLSGTPTQSGSFAISFTASNGVTPNATQSFTLTVDQAPAITSASSTTFATGTSNTFTVTATGFPTPTITEVGTLPTGVSFSGSTLSGTPTQSGTFPITFHANNGIGTQATQSFTLTVSQAPAITSANNTTFVVGTAGTFTVTATGSPTPTITEAGTLPTGVTFSGGVLSGTPTQSGSFAISFTASNGVTPNATQSFTLIVDQAPAITSASSTTFATGTSNTFTVTATGFPTPTITEVGTLPTGVSFSGSTLSGTPTQSGTFPITFHANNGIGTQATQSFTLTVSQAPAITSANNTTFVVGTAGTFTVTATGSPTPTITEAGTLPTGVTFSGGKLSGTPTQSGSFPITFYANNGVGTQASQSFTLTVDQAPAITSANTASFALGAASSFTVTTTGFPIPTSITESGNLPAGVTFTNNGNGTATLAGVPTAGGTFNISFTAVNGVSPNATQSFTLTTSGPLAIVAPSALNFGTVYLGSITPKAVTLTNAGNAPMTINDPRISIATGGDSNEFVVVNLCPRTLAPGRSCTIIVTFVAGPFFNPQTATLSITDNAPGSPQQVALTALVIDPQAKLSTSNWNFGTQKVNTSSAPNLVTLSNPGLTALAINGISISGANPADFSETNDCPASLPSRGSCTISVTFKPTAKGSRSASVVISDNTFNSGQRIFLSGTGD